jgi:hypothetical protein
MTNTTKDVQREILQILMENGYQNITNDTYVYENSEGAHCAIERPDDTTPVDSAYSPHSEYVEIFFDSVDQANEMFSRFLREQGRKL